MAKARKTVRRPNGSGQIIRLGGTRSRPFAVRVSSGYDERTGKPTVRYISYHANYVEAEAALVAYRNNPVAKPDMTLKQLYEEWSAVKYRNLSYQTVANYEAAWKHLGRLGSMAVSIIRTGQLQLIIDTATYIPPYKKGEKKPEEKPLGRSSLEKIKALATLLFDYAVQNDIVDKNYAAFLTLPKANRTEKEAFSDMEVAQIEKAAQSGVKWADAVLTMICTGFRIEEFLTLTPFSVDLNAGTLTGGLKTDAGRNRVVPIHPKIRASVERWVSMGGETLICEGGKRISQKRFREKCYYPALEAAGVRRLTPHATRHTFASRLAAAGIDPVNIQKLIGHANYSVTANTYTHVDVATLSKAIGVL